MRRFLVLLMIVPAAGYVFAGGEQEAEPETTAAEGAAMPTEYNEAPMLAERVAAGELPPVDQRLPLEPMVIAPNSEIGQYGGTIVRGTNPIREANLLLNRPATDTIPNYVGNWEFNSDGSVITLFIREGLKWSDGEPVTADDYLFNYFDIAMNDEINTVVPPNWATVDGEAIEMEKVDDYTVRLTSSRPYYGIIHQMNLVGNNFYFGPVPQHFLEQYHADFNDEADALAQEAGFDHWWQYFRMVADLEDRNNNYTGEKLGRPTLNAWMFVEETPTAYTYERNPYYYKVDTAGNQLPYIDRHVTMKITDPQVRLLKILNGELDFAAWGTTIENYPTIKKNEDVGDYNAWVAKDLWGSAAVYCVNQTYQGDDADIINPLLQDVRFRRALSLAIDRDEINNLVALDQGTPRQATVHPDTPGFKQEWADAYAEFDPERANAILDEIGLTQRDSDGFRMTADGQELSIHLPIRGKNQIRVSITELVKGYWQDVGLRTTVRIVGGNLSNIQKSSTFHVFTWALDRVHGAAFVIARGSWLNPNFWFGPIGPLWKNWLATDGETGVEPPELVKNLHYRAEEMPFVSPQEQREIIQFIGDAYAENLWMIGTVGMIGKPVISKKDLGNVRREAYPDNISTGAVRNQWMEQFYWMSEAKRSQ